MEKHKHEMNIKEKEIILEDLQEYLTKVLNGFAIHIVTRHGALVLRIGQDYYFRFYMWDDGEIEEYNEFLHLLDNRAENRRVASISDPKYREKVEAFIKKEITKEPIVSQFS